MKIISWNCKKGLSSREKYKKLIEFSPDIAVIQECFHPSEFQGDSQHHDMVWVGENKARGLGLCVLSFSEDYKLSMLVDEAKYEWIVPIQVSGKENFTLLAVWTKRMTGYSYGKVLYSALKEYESFLQGNPVLIIGDFNVDKKVPSSYSGIKGFSRLTDLFREHGLESCYHYFSKEEYGSERHATYYHYGKRDRPFHIDYCMVSKEILQNVQKFYIGESEEWGAFSDHLPLILDIKIGSVSGNVGNSAKGKTEITPDLLKEQYSLKIDNEIATEQEIDEAIRYIKASRLM
ncbi:hypothetical protein L2D08_10385 [Domibacillus sp. PGB-M46]|uniref:hypothetical protein n=1 Tax=Domibacillus sp. PGB-M46 TaxID=2910255 RepID=UPI001F57E527|nr:hypothetical protein [Domibacillus sp. PGB-M46]MCI2254771.1 hypothetical protein [Domibacillus sp. PGB-M46]